MIDLHGRVAVVTGAGRGLGRAYAQALSHAGAAVVVNDVDSDVATECVEGIRNAGGRAVLDAGAVGTQEVAERLVATATATFGRLDIMVANAGALRDSTLRKTTDEDFDLVLSSHLRGAFTCGRAAEGAFRAQGEGGRLILVGSPAGQRASFGQTSYSAAKGAIVAMTRTWAVECRRIGVTVNAIIPTALTRMVATIPGLADLVVRADRGESLPPSARRAGLGTAADAAPLVVWLSSDEARNVTGQAISVGGDRIGMWSHPTEVGYEYHEGGWSAEGIDHLFSSGRLKLCDFESLPISLDGPGTTKKEASS